MLLTVSLLAENPAQLLEFGPRAVERADLVEVRLDHVRDGDLPEWERAVLALGKAFVVTLHGPGGLGTVAGTIARHVSILRAAAGWGARYVDVDYRLAEDCTNLPRGCSRIVSMHVTGPWDGGWKVAYSRLLGSTLPGDRIKFVVAAETAVQGLQVMEWGRGLPPHPVGRVLFCMGERVGFTRLIARALGDPWMYVAPLGSGGGPWKSAAKGQLQLEDVRAMNLPEVGPEPRFCAVLGHPIGHSLSPEVHGAALREFGENTTFLAIDPTTRDRDPGDARVDEAGLDRDWEIWMQAATRFGFQGFAVTAPFKARALESCDSSSELADAVGAANTLVRRDGGWWAHNTDVVGVQRALELGWSSHRAAHGLPALMAGLKALIIGSGGAARAARAACVELGLQVDVCTRRPESGSAWTGEFGGQSLAPWEVEPGAHQVVLQTTPLGWAGRGTPLPPQAIGAGTLVLDAVYHPRETPLQWAAKIQGASTVGGRGWFLAQAEEQFRSLTGVEPGLGTMGSALEGALGRRFVSEALPIDGPLVLIGMRAVGKSTLGRALAAELGSEFVDADLELARSYGASHPDTAWATAGQILKGVGLSEFRRLEQEVLGRLLEFEGPLVIATGGGVVESAVCRGWLAERALCIWIDLKPSEIQARLQMELGDRPGLTGAGPIAEVPAVYARRVGLYGGLAQIALSGNQAPEGVVPQDLLRTLTSRSSRPVS
ncbi:MAG: type I 3-dehydroquinate dehydratase [Planctomycetota bacterium]|nr:type I 3-dehydroquinate dehydratase [Planctomycetota bacterium]